MKKHCLLLLLLMPGLTRAAKVTTPREYYSIIIYHLQDAAQETFMDSYLKRAFLPALHRAGIKKAGVFKLFGNDTAADRRIYVLIPGRSVEQLLKLPQELLQEGDYNMDGNDYINAEWNKPAYLRMETIILEAFSGMPVMSATSLQSPKKERIYELRSYESATEKLHKNKVGMFNNGDEIGIFRRLGFNAVFYGTVLSGSRMPNLMYMTTFENRKSRDEHWKAFGADPAWKKLQSDQQYNHNTSRNEIIFLQPAEYSDL